MADILHDDIERRVADRPRRMLLGLGGIGSVGQQEIASDGFGEPVDVGDADRVDDATGDFGRQVARATDRRAAWRRGPWGRNSWQDVQGQRNGCDPDSRTDGKRQVDAGDAAGARARRRRRECRLDAGLRAAEHPDGATVAGRHADRRAPALRPCGRRDDLFDGGVVSRRSGGPCRNQVYRPRPSRRRWHGPLFPCADRWAGGNAGDTRGHPRPLARTPRRTRARAPSRGTRRSRSRDRALPRSARRTAHRSCAGGPQRDRALDRIAARTVGSAARPCGPGGKDPDVAGEIAAARAHRRASRHR